MTFSFWLSASGFDLFFSFPAREKKNGRRRPTLARPGDALPSAKGPLTAVFGMGTGISAPLWPPAERIGPGKPGNQREPQPPRDSRGEIEAKPHVWLVPVSSTARAAYTPGLSRSSSATRLQGLASGKACLWGGLALRCFQRLSVPGIATGPAAGATARTPWARDSRSSRTRESSRQPSCAHRG